MSDNPIVQCNAEGTINQVITSLCYISAQLKQQANLEQLALNDIEPTQTNNDLAALATFVDCNQMALEVSYSQHNREATLLNEEIATLQTKLAELTEQVEKETTSETTSQPAPTQVDDDDQAQAKPS
jgi:hypothetical protein